MDITRAVSTILNILEREDELSDDVIAIAENVLSSVYSIESKQLRIQIIQEAAIMAGLLRAEDID